MTYKGEAVVIGGFVPGAELTSGQSDRVFALRDGAWVPLPKLNHARAAAGAAVVGDKIVVVGGQADGKLVPQTEVFDGERWTDVAELPTPREHLGAASDGRYVYAVGGRALSADQNSGTLERYDPENDTWTKLDSMPKVAGSVGVTYAAGRVFAIGGEGTTSVSDTVQAYDIPKAAGRSCPRYPPPATASQPPRSTARSMPSAGRPSRGTSARPRKRTCSTSPAGRHRRRPASTGGPSRTRRSRPSTPARPRRRARLARGRDRCRRERDHRNRSVRPRDQQLDRGAEAAAGAAPRDGRDLPG